MTEIRSTTRIILKLRCIDFHRTVGNSPSKLLTIQNIYFLVAVSIKRFVVYQNKLSALSKMNRISTDQKPYSETIENEPKEPEVNPRDRKSTGSYRKSTGSDRKQTQSNLKFAKNDWKSIFCTYRICWHLSLSRIELDGHCNVAVPIYEVNLNYRLICLQSIGVDFQLYKTYNLNL